MFKPAHGTWGWLEVGEKVQPNVCKQINDQPTDDISTNLILLMGAVAQSVACPAHGWVDETFLVRVSATALCLLRNVLQQDIRTKEFISTQPFVPPGPTNSAGGYGGL